MLRQFLSSSKVRNYLIVIASVVFLIVITILADFGDKQYLWARDNNGVPVEYYLNHIVTESDVLEMIKAVQDPEVPINIVDLGLILDVDVDEGNVIIDMILTSPYCPYSSTIIDEIRKTLFKYDKINSVILTVKSNPAWSYERLTDDGKKAVGELFQGEQSHDHQD